MVSSVARLFALLLCPALVMGQAAAPAASDTTLHVTSRIVYVDVVVHDAGGRLVRGLTQKDFTVLEDGQPQQIDYFVAHNYDLSAPRPATAPRPRNEFSNVPAAGPTGSVNMILFDMVNTAPQNQQFARKQMLEFLKALPPGQ